jgi:hypothetical protein
VPAKYSERNAAIDALPNVTLNLTDEQKQRIRAAISEGPLTDAKLEPANLLPPAVELRALPNQLEKEIPALRGIGFVRTKNGILLVETLQRVVVDEIATPAR